MQIRVQFGWGRRAARLAGEMHAASAIVDTLSFSTACAVGCAQGAIIRPFQTAADARNACEAHPGMHLAVKRELATDHMFSLSPVSLQKAKAGDIIALPSPNGATCCTISHSAGAASICVGALVNAHATAAYLASSLKQGAAEAWVVACGERTEASAMDEPIRFAIEDYLGAGAILSVLEEEFCLSAEAAMCASAFRANAARLCELITASESGQELIGRNSAADVDLAARLNTIGCPVVAGNHGLSVPTAW
jgi:2-phosphosulfolactate phosphatase